MSEIIEICQAEMLQAINRAEIDIQISTAKQYPRDIERAKEMILKYAAPDQSTAESCLYALPRKDEFGNPKLIEGLSIRMAELIAASWGNLRIQTRIISNDGKMVTVQGVCHDLESNLAVSKEVQRSIVTKKGYSFTPEMQAVTVNAAIAIAYRNAVLAVIPKAITKSVIDKVIAMAKSKGCNIKDKQNNAIEYINRIGVTQQQLFDALHIQNMEQLDEDALLTLRLFRNSIKEGVATVQDIFLDTTMNVEEKKKSLKSKSRPTQMP